MKETPKITAETVIENKWHGCWPDQAVREMFPDRPIEVWEIFDLRMGSKSTSWPTYVLDEDARYELGLSVISHFVEKAPIMVAHDTLDRAWPGGQPLTPYYARKVRETIKSLLRDAGYDTPGA